MWWFVNMCMQSNFVLFIYNPLSQYSEKFGEWTINCIAIHYLVAVAVGYLICYLPLSGSSWGSLVQVEEENESFAELINPGLPWEQPYWMFTIMVKITNVRSPVCSFGATPNFVCCRSHGFSSDPHQTWWWCSPWGTLGNGQWDVFYCGHIMRKSCMMSAKLSLEKRKIKKPVKQYITCSTKGWSKNCGGDGSLCTLCYSIVTVATCCSCCVHCSSHSAEPLS